MHKIVGTFVLLLLSLSTFATSTGIRISERKNDTSIRNLDFYPTLSYQGLLKDNNENIIEDGYYNLTFKIYDTEDAEEAIWKEVQKVEITNGIINCFIGAKEKLDLPFNRQYWLSVGVNDEELPKMVMAGTPYSLYARRIAEDAIVAGKYISLSKDEDGKIVLSGEGSTSKTSSNLYDTPSFNSFNTNGLKMINCKDPDPILYPNTDSQLSIGLNNTNTNELESVSFGRDSKANGYYSLASGFNCKTYGIGNLSIGINSIAGYNGDQRWTFGQSCFAGGINSEAIGISSLSFGNNVKSNQNYCYAFGNNLNNMHTTEGNQNDDGNTLYNCFMVGFNNKVDPDFKRSQLYVGKQAVCIGFSNMQILDYLINRDTTLPPIPQNSLIVNSNIYAKALELSTEVWPDYVFEDDYDLRPLDEVELFILKNKHLPGIIPKKEAIENRVNVGDIQVKLLEKVEELTLYIIEQNKQIKELQDKVK